MQTRTLVLPWGNWQPDRFVPDSSRIVAGGKLLKSKFAGVSYGQKKVRAWVHRSDLLYIRPAEEREMVEPGQFAKPGDMVLERPGVDDYLIVAAHMKDYVRVGHLVDGPLL